jgi:probable HAF family extracellular repeat protein
VKWTPTGTSWVITDLGPELGPGWSSAYAINATGDIVGAKQSATGNGSAFVLTAAGSFTDLGIPSGLTYSSANDINANGEVVGVTGVQGSPSQAFYWSAATGMVILPALAGATNAFGGAASINDNGVIAGSTTDGVSSFAVRWGRVAGAWVASKLPSGEGVGAQAISNNGNIVGTGCQPNVSPCAQRAYFWPAGGARIDLGTLGGIKSFAYGVNDAGRVVGQSYTKTGYTRAFSWTAAGGMKELATLGNVRSIAWAQGMSNAGIIVGASTYGNLREDSPWHGTLWMVP